MNVAADHLGLKDVNTLEDLARVKSVVPRAVSRRGYAVLNAEDPLVYGMRELTDGQVVLFSMDENNRNIKRHMERGRISCVYENGHITILKGKWKVRIEKVTNIPLTYGGRAEFMVQNVLAATLACSMMSCCWDRAVNSRSRADCMASSINESANCCAWLSTLTA